MCVEVSQREYGRRKFRPGWVCDIISTKSQHTALLVLAQREIVKKFCKRHEPKNCQSVQNTRKLLGWRHRGRHRIRNRRAELPLMPVLLFAISPQ